MAKPSLARRCLAEALATFALVFAGCGAIVVDQERGGSLGAVGVAASFGLVIMVMIYATGHLSGAHINPAVTVAFTALRHFPAKDALAYIPLSSPERSPVRSSSAWSGTDTRPSSARRTRPLAPAPR